MDYNKSEHYYSTRRVAYVNLFTLIIFFVVFILMSLGTNIISERYTVTDSFFFYNK